MKLIRTNDSLQAYVEAVSEEWFHHPFRHRATFNSRLRTTGGRYHLQTHHLDFNPKILDVFGEVVFLGVVKHELCHYHLHIAGRGYQHRDADFRKLLKKLEAYGIPHPSNKRAVWRNAGIISVVNAGSLIIVSVV